MSGTFSNNLVPLEGYFSGILIILVILISTDTFTDIALCETRAKLGKAKKKAMKCQQILYL